jgi:nucleoside-diphosphate-sugar epimerase
MGKSFLQQGIEMKNVLITGGTGFIGSHIARCLLNQGFEVTIFDNNSRGKVSRIEDIKNHINFIDGDVRNQDALVKASRKADTLVHLAFVNGTQNFYDKAGLVLDVAIDGLKSVVEAINKNSVSNIILASSSEVYQSPGIFPTPEEIAFSIPSLDNPRYSYGLGKIIQEFYLYHAVEKIENLTIFRPHNIYGNDMGNLHVIPQMFENAVKSKKLNLPIEIQGDGRQTRSFCFIDDFIQAFNLIFLPKQKRQVYNIGTKEEITILELMQKILNVIDLELPINFRSLPEGSTLRRIPDISKIERLGFVQNISLNEGLKIYFENEKSLSET